MEMQDQNVRVLDAWDLLDVYKSQHIYTSSSINVYQLVQHFIENNPNADIIIDEAPMFSQRSWIIGGKTLTACNFCYLYTL